MPSRIIPIDMAPDTPKSQSSKKDKSSHREKKRRREHGDSSQKSPSKKHKSKSHSTSGSHSKEHRQNSQQISESQLDAQSSPRQDIVGSQISISHTPEEISPFHTQTSSLFLPLAPISQKTPLEGLCAEHLSPLIMTYYPPFSGVLLSYSNPRVSEKPFGNDGATVCLKNIDEYAVSWGWVTAEFLVFKPKKAGWLEGFVNFQTEGHLGVVCWNMFNASIERKRLPEDWKWVGVEELDVFEGQGVGDSYAENGVGYWVDGEGKKVDGVVRFRVKEIESSHDRERGFLTIEGTMLDEETEAEMVAVEMQRRIDRVDAGRRLGGLGALGATSLGVTIEADMMDVDPDPKKHRTIY